MGRIDDYFRRGLWERLWFGEGSLVASVGTTAVVLGVNDLAVSPMSLPAGTYAFDDPVENGELIALGWLMESYRFGAYRSASPPDRLRFEPSRKTRM